MSATTSNEFDLLEKKIAKMDVPHEKLILSFSNFLLNLISKNRFANISKDELKSLASYLDRNLILHAQKDETSMRKIDLELIRLGEKQCENRAFLSLVSCLRLIYVTKYEWEEFAQDTLLFNFLARLRDVLKNIEHEFVDYFNKALFTA